MADFFQKVPPQNLDAEQSLLGSMMLSEEAFITAFYVISEDDFYQVSHREIFKALAALYAAQKPCDIVTLQEQLKANGKLAEVGGLSYLSQLLNAVPTSKNAEFYAKIVKEKAMLRRLITVSSEIVDSAYDPQAEAEPLIDTAEQRILQLSRFKVTKPYQKLKDLLIPTFNHLEQLHDNKTSVTGVTSGFPRLDEYTAGFQPSDLVILAARPSMGKTAMAMNIAANAAYKDVPVMIFSLEMSHSQLVTRLLSSEARVDGSKLRRGYISDEEWRKLSMASGVLSEAPIILDDTPNASMMEIRSKARRAFAQEKIGLIIIDYLQLITWSGQDRPESRQQEVSAISRSLKGLARELNVPVICLSQLSRAVESRPDKRPMLSDLRESGAIEQDADVVMFLYREEYYNPKKEDIKGQAEAIIAKQRNGPVGTVRLAFNSSCARFDTLETFYTEP